MLLIIEPSEIALFSTAVFFPGGTFPGFAPGGAYVKPSQNLSKKVFLNRCLVLNIINNRFGSANTIFIGPHRFLHLFSAGNPLMIQ